MTIETTGSRVIHLVADELATEDNADVVSSVVDTHEVFSVATASDRRGSAPLRPPRALKSNSDGALAHAQSNVA